MPLYQPPRFENDRRDFGGWWSGWRGHNCLIYGHLWSEIIPAAWPVLCFLVPGAQSPVNGNGEKRPLEVANTHSRLHAKYMLPHFMAIYRHASSHVLKFFFWVCFSACDIYLEGYRKTWQERKRGWGKEGRWSRWVLGES